MSVVEVRHLTLSRGGSPVLRDVSLAIEKGEVFMLIGPSGSGKSSLLRCLNRLEEPPPGSVFFNGTDITTRPVTEIRCRVGMVFQQAAMFPGTVGDKCGLWARHAGGDAAAGARPRAAGHGGAG